MSVYDTGRSGGGAPVNLSPNLFKNFTPGTPKTAPPPAKTAPPPVKVIQVRAHTRAAPAKPAPKPTAPTAPSPTVKLGPPAPTPPPASTPPLATPSLRPSESSGVKRYTPNFRGEPVAGYDVVQRNPDGSIAKQGNYQPGVRMVKRPYYTNTNTLAQKAGPTGQESTQWNAAQVATAKKIQVANYGKPGYIARSLIPGGLDEGGTTSVAKAITRGVEAGSTLLPGGGVGEAAGLFGLGLKGLRVVRGAEDVAKAAPAVAHVTPEAAAVRTGLKGAPTVRAGQAAGFSSQRADRFARAEAIYRDTSLTPEEREAKAGAALKGQLERPVYMGFKKLDPESVTNLKSQIMTHNTLRTGQKATLLRSLNRAVAGIVPTAGEQKLLEQTFGKAVSGGINQAAKSGRWKNIATNVVNVPRTLQATADMSAFLRQGFVALGRHPVITGKNFVPMVKAFGSEGYARGVEQGIAEHPNFPLMQAGKLALTGGDALSPHEEQFAAHMLETMGGTKNPIRWSSRSYSTFLNKTRADIFNHMLDVAHGQGINVHNEQFLRDLGEMVNTFTGRGGLPKSFERGANIFNGLFFSPRLMASRIRVLGQPLNPALARRNPFIYKQYVRAALQSAGGLFTILGLAKLNGLNVGADPRSADFGKIKFGNTRVDLGAGFLQYFHLLGEAISRQYKSSTTGKVTKLGGGPAQRSVYDVLNDFMSGKLSPPFGVAADVLKQQTGVGPFDPKQEAVSHLSPLSWQDVYDIYKQHGGGLKRIPPAAAGAALSTFGGGVQTYGPKAPKASGGSGGGGSVYNTGGGSGGSGSVYNTG